MLKAKDHSSASTTCKTTPRMRATLLRSFALPCWTGAKLTTGTPWAACKSVWKTWVFWNFKQFKKRLTSKRFPKVLCFDKSILLRLDICIKTAVRFFLILTMNCLFCHFTLLLVCFSAHSRARMHSHACLRTRTRADTYTHIHTTTTAPQKCTQAS